MIDTHAHLDFPEFKDDLPDVLNRANESGIEYIITVGTDLESSRKAIALAHRYAQIYAAIGIHPHNAHKVTEEEWEEFRKLVNDDKVVAIGETGLDLHKDYSPIEAQKELFIRHLNLAKESGKPFILHAREAHQQCIQIIKEVMGDKVRGVAHCFSGSADDAKQYLNMGLLISVGGPVTYPNADGLRKVLKQIAVESLLLETDCPFLAPQTKRGQRNEPSFLSYCMEEFSRIYGLSREDISRITNLNALRLFGLKDLPTNGEIAYPIRSSLYLNVTNRCTSQCFFCVTKFTDYVKGHNLRLKQEPTAEEIIREIPGDVAARYKEVVFCGYGEPTLRLDVIKAVAGYLKKKYNIHIRLNTNGHGNLIHQRNICPELKGLVDTVSVSLNADNPKDYEKTCRPQFGEITFDKVIEFVKDAKQDLPYVQITTVLRPGVTFEKYEGIARELGIDFRARIYNEVG